MRKMRRHHRHGDMVGQQRKTQRLPGKQTNVSHIAFVAAAGMGQLRERQRDQGSVGRRGGCWACHGVLCGGQAASSHCMCTRGSMTARSTRVGHKPNNWLAGAMP